MSHCIQAFVIDKKIIDADFLNEIPYVEENGYCIIPITEKLIKRTGNTIQDEYREHIEKYLAYKYKTFAYVETDYFGGCGDQSAKAWLDGRRIPSDSIDQALKIIGVICAPDLDEFDTINLGKYRSDEEIIRSSSDLKVIRKYKTFLLTAIPGVISTNCIVRKEKRIYYPNSGDHILHIEDVGFYHVYVKRALRTNTFSEFNEIVETQTFRKIKPEDFVSTKKFLNDNGIRTISIEHINDGDIYHFYTCKVDIESDDLSRLCLVQVDTDENGQPVTIHDALRPYIIPSVDMGNFQFFEIGTSSSSNKKPLKKKVVTAYECPVCTVGTLLEHDSNTYQCDSCGHTEIIQKS